MAYTTYGSQLPGKIREQDKSNALVQEITADLNEVRRLTDELERLKAKVIEMSKKHPQEYVKACGYAELD